MLCYFISKKDLSILDIVEASAYSITLNLDCSGKTKIDIAGKPLASDGDFLVLKDGKTTKFKGIIESISNSDGEIKHTISCLEMEQLFNRKIALLDVDLIRNTGIEDFIANAIANDFSESGDAFVDLAYIQCNVLTHTKISAKPDNENGIFNLKTYIGNVKEKYGIFLEFEFTKDNLIINISKKEQAAMQIDTMISDVATCTETYKVNALAKLNLIWKNTLTDKTTTRTFYLHPDRSTSEVDTNRIDGTISTEYVEAETEEEMIEAARNHFKSNSYSHLIEASILNGSKLYPAEELYAGHEIDIKTAAAGIQRSIISEISFTDDADVIAVKFGILKVSLTSKLKN